MPTPTTPQQYPKMKFHPDGKTRTVRSKQEEDFLSPEWGDKPFPAPKKLVENSCPNCLRMQDAFDRSWKDLQARQETERKDAAATAKELAEVSGRYDRLASEHQKLLDDFQALKLASGATQAGDQPSATAKKPKPKPTTT